jgi:predicted AAA+ superfamily ATPase
MKQWMAQLLRSGIAPEQITYLTGELIDDHHAMVRLIEETLGETADKSSCFLILDEVTYIRNWDKGIKFMADAGMLENVVLLLTGSDLGIIREARMRFPGRRGASDIVNFHFYPLNFFETIHLKERLGHDALDILLDTRNEAPLSLLVELHQEFEHYLVHGGFLTAINDFERNRSIRPATFTTYSDWIRGDIIKRGKQEHYLREILNAIVTRYGSQITWNSLSQDLSIDHPKTVSDYIELLVAMDAAFVQYAVIEDKLIAAPKKARKLMFTDPFIFHSVRAWLNPTEDPYRSQVATLFDDSQLTARLVETSLVTHYRQYFPSFYIKAKGEVDLAYISQNRFWPVEVKWSRQLRPKDLKQISKYNNGLILTKATRFDRIMDIPTQPLPLALLRIGAKERPDTFTP